MASIYKKGNKIYISWYDAVTGKNKNKSTGYEFSKSNMKKAKKIADDFQKHIEKKTEKRKSLGIKEITIKDAFDRYLRNNSQRHPKTIKSYKWFFKEFTKTFPETADCSILNKIKVEDWLNKIKQYDLSRNTIHDYSVQLNHFLSFLFEYTYLEPFVINRDIKPKKEIKEKIVFSDEEIKAIFNGLNVKNTNFKMLIYLSFYTGLRPSDILTIGTEGIDLENRIMKYYSPKRKVYREIAFHKDLIPILRSRIDEIQQGNLVQYNCSENSGRAITKYLDKIEIRKVGYTAYTFRRTFITLCRRNDMDPSVVNELTGHAHQNTSDLYYNRISIAKMKSELEKFIRPESKEKIPSQTEAETEVDLGENEDKTED